ncbi:uncharacterized protein LOC114749320 isoform X2 [Neltuma alba]|uniref:uncharacterized protein LOC114749320 isoform X2 n=1 Tax=Neltuma alba TaxID=207710 RepID=UPI0010A3661C|nr:uncharacterized protein LOC114749320 isoform X2 [Prosopis alba]
MCPKFRRTMKGLFERYRRWNPVHPTYGAFWGMGVGIGCGIGWGPGFGPEAIGYVGAGCGIGFSVGFTLAGLGVGFPVNFLFQVPYRATMATRGAALKLVGSSSLLSKKHFAGNDWTGIAPPVSELEREASERFSNFGQQHLSVKGADFFEMKNSLPSLATSACESCRALNTRLFNSHRGLDSQSTVTGTSSATMQHTFCKEPPSASKKPALVLISPYCITGHNYFQWLSSLMLSAHDRGKANGLTRSAALSSVDNPKYATWEAENSLVQSWFTDALTREIGKNLLLYKIAHDVWTGERTSYSSVNNKAILFDTECFLHDFRQGNLDVTQYYNVLVRHWQLLDLYEIHQWYCETDAQHFNALKEEKRVYKFLIGLNPIFEKIRHYILSLDPLPTLEEVFFEVKKEESRNKLTPGACSAYDVPESSALVAKDAHSNDYKLKKF